MSRFAFIDALRGYAILAVIAVHVSQAIPGLPWPLRPLVDQGARGVQLFYVASAITLCLSWTARNDGALPFYVRRLFRIAPLFWIAIVGFVSIQGVGPRYWAPNGIDWRHILATATFLHGFHPQSITSVVPGSWTIANEMLFYALFPILIAVLRSGWLALLAAAMSLWFATWLYPISIRFMPAVFPGDDPGLVANYATLWFPNQLPAFLIGMVAFYVIRRGGIESPIVVRCGLAACAGTVIALPFVTTEIQLHLLYSVVFGAFSVLLAKSTSRLLVNPAICWIGRTSFGGYLWHFMLLDLARLAAVNGYDPFDLRTPQSSPMLFLLLFVIIAAATVAMATITYWTIEKPGIAIGNRIAGVIAKPARARLTPAAQAG